MDRCIIYFLWRPFLFRLHQVEAEEGEIEC
jgi:hypothetical protein